MAFASSLNPVRFVAASVATLDIVGFDQRSFSATQRAFTAPLRAVDDAVNRMKSRLVMTVPDAPPAVVGDLGFDPLRLGSDDNLSFMREAELKHGRLAMLAAIAWPLQEILHPIIVDALISSGNPVTDVLIESGGASPSLLNGGLEQGEIFPALALFTIGTSILEEKDLNARKELSLGWNEYGPIGAGNFGRLPGNYRFDPLNLYRPLSDADKVGMQERELLNGRVAMIAVASYVGIEFVAPDTTVVRATPALFEPLILQPWFRSAMDAAFSVASMDGSIDGVAY